jgi:hypothetical protein
MISSQEMNVKKKRLKRNFFIKDEFILGVFGFGETSKG